MTARPVPAVDESTVGGKRRGHSEGGRRDVTKLGLKEQRVVLRDPMMEALVAKGEATYAGFEESARLTWNRTGSESPEHAVEPNDGIHDDRPAQRLRVGARGHAELLGRDVDRGSDKLHRVQWGLPSLQREYHCGRIRTRMFVVG